MMAPKGHALPSASSSDRWLHCPPSARLCESYDDKAATTLPKVPTPMRSASTSSVRRWAWKRPTRPKVSNGGARK